MSAQSSSPKKWTALICHDTPEDVQLFYDFRSSSAGFSLVLTDLCRVWDGSLQREEVITEAQKQSCSIDPSESTTQFQTLLSKLKQSLIEGRNGLGVEKTHSPQSLCLRTSMKLPAPLRQLRWTFTLRPQDGAQISREIIYPLLQEASLMEAQISSLFRILKEKDHVLSKLLDKIDNSAMDLSVIFPGIAGIKSRRHRVGIAEASKHVPGMAIFNKTAWEAGFERSNPPEAKSDFSTILHHYKISGFSENSLGNWTGRLSVLKEPGTSDTNSEADTETRLRERTTPPVRNKSSNPVNAQDGSETESEFEELQITPQKNKGARTAAADLDMCSPAINRSRSGSPSSSPSPSPKAGPAVTPEPDDSDSDSSTMAISASKSQSQAKTKLGLLGGKKRQARSSLSPASQPASSVASTPSRRLGVVGGRRATGKSPSDSPAAATHTQKAPGPQNEVMKAESNSSGTPTSSPSPERPPSPGANLENRKAPLFQQKDQEEVEETVEERARRRRVELKRPHASAGGVKKKARKF